MKTLIRETIARDKTGGERTVELGPRNVPRNPIKKRPVPRETTPARLASGRSASLTPRPPTVIRPAPHVGPRFWLEKSLNLFGLVVGALLTLLFSLDLAFGWPLQRASTLFDVCSFACGLILLYLGWDVLRSQMMRRLWSSS